MKMCIDTINIDERGEALSLGMNGRFLTDWKKG
jgi:hypothetical protein